MRRRPIVATAATAGVAYHMGKKHEQGQAEAYDSGAAQVGAEQPQYAPPPPAAQPHTAAPAAGGDTVGELERLAKLHDAGVLTDDEFAAAKAKELGV